MKVYAKETIEEITSLIDSVKHRLSPELFESGIARNTLEIIENKLVSHEVQSVCEECGEVLGLHYFNGTFHVEPCKHCLDEEGERAINHFREETEMKETYDSLDNELRQECRRRA